MKGLTLDYCKDVKISDLWLGTAVFKRGANTPKDILESLNAQDEETNIEETYSEIRNELIKSGMSPEQADDWIYNYSKSIYEMSKLYSVQMFLLKTENGRYYSLNDGTLDPDDAERIIFLEPLSDYYNDFKFNICNGKVCIDLESTEPFERYRQKVEESLFGD